MRSGGVVGEPAWISGRHGRLLGCGGSPAAAKFWVASWCGDASAERPERGKPIDCRWTCGSAGVPPTSPSVEQQHVIPDVAARAGGQCSNKRPRPILLGAAVEVEVS